MSNAHANRRRCTARTAQGKPCRMPPMRGQARCFNHAKAVAAKRRAARAKGGSATKTAYATQPADVTTLTALQQHVGQLLADVMLRENTEKRALAAARLIEVARRLIESADLEARVAALEAVLRARGEL
jgi:hypothetical protein